MGINILHILLSILLFFSSTGLEINSHFCSGKYKYSSFYVQPDNCCKKIQGQLPSKDSCQDEFSQTPCCQNKANFFKSKYPQNITLDSAEDVTFPTSKIINTYNVQFGQNHFQRLDIDYFNYKPPLIKQDFSILFQVFRC